MRARIPIALLFVACLLDGGASSADAPPASAQPSICKREQSFTSNADTGFYITYLDLYGEHKISDAYPVFYQGLSDGLAKVADAQCKAGKPNLEIIKALDYACHDYCKTQGPSFVKSLGWFKGGHLVGECHEICSVRTSANKTAFPAASKTSVIQAPDDSDRISSPAR